MTLNQVGPRTKKKYIMDDGTTIKLKLDATYANLAACGLEDITTADNAINKPSNFKPRVVFWIPNADIAATDTTPGRTREQLRRELVCASSSDAYTSVDNFTIEIDGIAGQTTGRRGEKVSF